MKEEDKGYRHIWTYSFRDLSPLKFQEQANIVYNLWQSNGMAGRIIEILVDYIIGDGVTWHCKNKKLDDILWEFWSDPDNDFELFQYDLVQELFLYGEFVLPMYVLEPIGKVKTGYIDPANIIRVVKNRNNPRFIESIVVKTEDEAGNPVEKELKVISKNRDVMNKKYGKYEGDCFVFQINKVSNADRGLSEIYRLADWIRALDAGLFSSLERIQYLMNFIWDITISDVDDEKVLEDVRQRILNEPFYPGSIHIHTNRESIEAKAPDLKTEQISQYVELLRNFVLGAAGIPTSWYGEGDITRATALEQASPILRKLRRKQKYVKRLFEKILEFVKEKAIEYGRLKPEDYQSEDELNITVVMTEIASKEVIQLFQTLNEVIKSIVVAENQEWISKDRARELFYEYSKRILDVEIEPETKEQIEKESKEFEDRIEKEVYGL